MRRYLLILVIFAIIVSSCDEKEPDEPGLPASNGVSGFVQKGPFVSGSNIIVQILDEEFNPTGASFTVSTIDDFGSFELESEIAGVYAEFIAQGFYFNEVAGSISSASLTLRALAKVTPDMKSNVNILTTLSRNRIVHLVKEEQKSFEDAKTQAEAEILSAFDITIDEDVDFNSMDIGESGAQNAVLLAISSIMQGNQTVGQLSELISKVILDVEDNGTIDTGSTIAKINDNATHLLLAGIRTNLQDRYSDLGLQLPIPDFEKYAKRLVPISVVNRFPEANATDVPYDISSVYISFNKALDPSTVNTGSVTLATTGGTPVTGQVLYHADNFKVEFVPDTELLPELTYKLIITSAAKTLDGTDFSGTDLTFSTLDIDIESDILAYFPLNGDASDESEHGKDATAVNTAFGPGIDNQALKFSGEGSYLEIPNVMNMTEAVWTYATWFNLDELPAGTSPYLLAARLSGNAFWDVPLYIRSSAKTVATYNETALNVGDNTVDVGNWHHAAIVIENGTIKMYLDGELKASNDNFQSHQSNPGYEDYMGDATGSYEYYTGKYYISEKFRGESLTGYMKGSVDNVRFYSRALNKYEIKKLFTEKQ